MRLHPSVLGTQQPLEAASLCALELCKGYYATGDGPDLTAVAQYGLQKGFRKLALDNCDGVMHIYRCAIADIADIDSADQT